MSSSIISYVEGFRRLKERLTLYDSTSGSRWSFERHKFGGFSLTISQKSWAHFLDWKNGIHKPGWCSFMRHDVVHPGTSYFSNTSEQLYFKPDSEATLVARSTCFIGFQDCVSVESYQSLMLGVLPLQKPQNGTTKIFWTIPVAAGFLGMFLYYADIVRLLRGKLKCM